MNKLNFNVFVFSIVLFASLIQNSTSNVIGCPNNLIGNGLAISNGLPLNGIGNMGFGAGNAALAAGNAALAAANAGPIVGTGEVSVGGKISVDGSTSVTGSVPVIGYITFEGTVPAGGIVSVAPGSEYKQLVC